MFCLTGDLALRLTDSNYTTGKAGKSAFLKNKCLSKSTKFSYLQCLDCAYVACYVYFTLFQYYKIYSERTISNLLFF